MRRILSALSFALICLALALPAPAASLDAFKGQSGSLDIAGGTAHIPVMKAAAQKIMEANPKIAITVAGGGSGVGVQKAGEGLVQIGNTGRALSKEEVAKYGLKSFPFAIDGVCVAVNPANPVSGLTAAQVRDIYAGTVANWKAVGGADAPITLYTRDEASGTREVFWKKLLGKGDIAAAANVVASNGAMKVAIAQDPNAIGYVGIGFIDATIKAPALDGVAPSQESAADGSYPVVRKLFMNTKGEPASLTKAFIDFVLAPENVDLITASGYIPLKK